MNQGESRGRSGGGALRVGVLSSARAPGLGTLLRRGGGSNAPYRVAGVLASDPEGGALRIAREAGVPAVAHAIGAWGGRASSGDIDREARRAYDRETVEFLRGVGADLVVMCGYLLIATDVLLEAFPRRVVNIHDADLTLTDGQGVPLYRGLRSTRDAVVAGEPETRSTVHLATREVDEGPPLVRSRAFPAHESMVERARRWEAEDLLKAYAYAQREWMMRACWGALLDRTLELFAGGRIRVVGDRALVDGDFGPEDVDERRTGDLPDFARREDARARRQAEDGSAGPGPAGAGSTCPGTAVTGP